MKNVVALGIGTFALALTAWTVLPAPTLALLALAVLVPELAPWFAATCIVAGAIAFALARGRARTIAVACATVAFGCTLVPIVQYPGARAAADAELSARYRDARATSCGPVATTAVRVLRDRAVVTRDGARLGLDVYRPAGAAARPAIVTIYGGAWIFGTRAQMASIDDDYARAGYTVVGIDYRHAPGRRFPTQVHDVEDALATIARNASAWGVDRRRVAVFGRSAGAELALLAGYERGPLTIRAVVAYYAPTDLTAGYALPPVPDPADVRRILTTYIGATPARDPGAYRRASPIDAVRSGLPPTLLAIGDRDELVRIEQQRALRDALRSHADPVVAIELPWSDHAFDALPSGLGASIATPITQRFLAATLACSNLWPEVDSVTRFGKTRGRGFASRAANHI